jgi:hypothetical protein
MAEERLGLSGARSWLLLNASRATITLILLGLIFVTLVILTLVDPVPPQISIASSDTVETLFQALLTAIITGVTLVVTITQLVLSKEIGTLGDQQERMDRAMDFRHHLESQIDMAVSPPEPTSFLREIVKVTGESASALAEVADTLDDDDASDQLGRYANDVGADAEQITSQLRTVQFGTFEMLFVALEYDYSTKIYNARRLKRQYETELSTETTDQIDRLVDCLTSFGAAREYFKSLYIEWELSNLSRTMLILTVPALLVSISGILFLSEPASIPGRTYGIANLMLVVISGVTIALGPFMLLLAYVLRIATVSKQTLAVGPFVLGKSGTRTSTDSGERRPPFHGEDP